MTQNSDLKPKLKSQMQEFIQIAEQNSINKNMLMNNSKDVNNLNKYLSVNPSKISFDEAH